MDWALRPLNYFLKYANQSKPVLKLPTFTNIIRILPWVHQMAKGEMKAYIILLGYIMPGKRNEKQEELRREGGRLRRLNYASGCH